MKNLRSLLLFLISILVLPNTFGCGGWVDYDSYFRLFKPEYVIAQNEFVSVAYSDEVWHEDPSWFSFEAKHSANVESWKEIFGDTFTQKEIEDFIYSNSIDDLQSSLKGNIIPDKSMLNWVTNNKKFVLDYMILALQSEEYCNQTYYYWEDKPEVDHEAMEQLIKKGLQASKKCNNQFIKERYIFQLVKLMRYAERYTDCLQFWQEYLTSQPRKNLIYYWTLDHVAGAQLAQSNKVEAWKYFMEVFKNCPSRRYSSYYSIKIKTDEEWNALYKSCDKDWQQETMHFIRASHMGSIALSDIQAIYNINPNSAYLPVLISREINKIESLFLQNNEEENEFYQLYFNQSVLNPELHSYVKNLTTFLDKTIQENKANNQPYLKLCASYSHFLLNEHVQTKTLLNKVSQENSGFKKQIDIINALLLVTNKSKSVAQKQNELKALWVPDVHDFTYFLMRHPSNKLPFPLSIREKMWELEMDLDTKKVEALLELTKNYQELTWFANFVLERNYLSTKNADGNSYNIQKITEMLGTCYLADNKYEMALATFSKLPERFRLGYEKFYLKYNPFNYIINDNDRSSLSEKTYSKLKFAKTIVAIQTAVKNGTATAMDHYLLGNAHYNTSYFGYAWNAKAYYRSGSYLTGVYDCTLAHSNYLKAAHLSNDKEMQAKCYYLAAKANQNLYITKTLKAEYLWDIDLLSGDQEKYNHRDEFEQLKNEYTDTEFYNRIIEECQYFGYYVN